jgi:hypothetical protein
MLSILTKYYFIPMQELNSTHTGMDRNAVMDGLIENI